MREPHLDEDVHCGCNLNVIKPNSEQTQENRLLPYAQTADEQSHIIPQKVLADTNKFLTVKKSQCHSVRQDFDYQRISW